jgi:hypothetical protein
MRFHICESKYRSDDDGKTLAPCEGDEWFIEVDDLIAFVRKHRQCVICEWINDSSVMSIEIYNSYRE